MRSISGSSRALRAGAVNRLGPIVNPGNRIPMRGKSTGSVRILIPKKLISTVACPSQATVTRSSLHSAGFGFANTGAMGRKLSTVHSRQRCANQRRTRELRRVGWSGGCIGWIEQSLVRLRTDSSRGELDVKNAGEAAIILASRSEIAIHLSGPRQFPRDHRFLQNSGRASARKPSSFRRARTEQPFERSQKTDRAFRFSGARHQDCAIRAI